MERIRSCHCVWSEFLAERTDEVIDSAITGVARTSQGYASEMFPCKYLARGGSQGVQASNSADVQLIGFP